MSRIRVGVVGATGYSGGVAARIVAAHPDFELAFATSDKLAGAPLAEHLALPAPGAFAPNAAALELAHACDAVLLATSAEVSAALAPKMLASAAGKTVVDLSGAFRLASAADYEAWYGHAHPAPELFGSAHYGLPELFGRAARHPASGAGGHTLIANPGCYPTAALLALAPLARAGLIEPAGIVVDGKSGVTGAGRQAKEEYAFTEVDEDVRPYKVGTHQHTPEIARFLGEHAAAAWGRAVPSVTFAAHLVPLKRGLLTTCYARPRAGATPARVAECLADAYAKTPFVRACAPSALTLKSVAGTNGARVAGAMTGDVVVALGAIDNLVKGAAGQAVQNVNLVFGLAETRGLDTLMRIAP